MHSGGKSLALPITHCFAKSCRPSVSVNVFTTIVAFISLSVSSQLLLRPAYRLVPYLSLCLVCRPLAIPRHLQRCQLAFRWLCRALHRSVCPVFSSHYLCSVAESLSTSGWPITHCLAQTIGPHPLLPEPAHSTVPSLSLFPVCHSLSRPPSLVNHIIQGLDQCLGLLSHTV